MDCQIYFSRCSNFPVNGDRATILNLYHLASQTFKVAATESNGLREDPNPLEIIGRWIPTMDCQNYFSRCSSFPVNGDRVTIFVMCRLAWLLIVKPYRWQRPNQTVCETLTPP